MCSGMMVLEQGHWITWPTVVPSSLAHSGIQWKLPRDLRRQIIFHTSTTLGTIPSELHSLQSTHFWSVKVHFWDCKTGTLTKQLSESRNIHAQRLNSIFSFTKQGRLHLQISCLNLILFLFKMVLSLRNSVNYLNYSNSLLFLMPFLMIFTST